MKTLGMEINFRHFYFLPSFISMAHHGPSIRISVFVVFSQTMR